MSIIYDIIKSDQNEKKAREKVFKSLHTLGEAELQKDIQEKKTRDAIIKCAKRKKALLESSLKDFVDLYSKIGKIQYMKTEGIKELEFIEKNEIQSMSQSIAISTSVQIMSPKQEVLTMLFRGGLGGAAHIMRRESEQELVSARMIQKESMVLSSQYESIKLASKIIYERVVRITDIITKINILLMKSNKVCNAILEKRGFDFRQYTSFEKDCITTYVISAKTLKQIIDVPIFENDGNLAEKSNELIVLGNNYIEQIKKVAEM